MFADIHAGGLDKKKEKKLPRNTAAFELFLSSFTAANRKTNKSGGLFTETEPKSSLNLRKKKPFFPLSFFGGTALKLPGLHFHKQMVKPSPVRGRPNYQLKGVPLEVSNGVG